MGNDKEIKKEFKAKASREPDKFYATSVLKSEGFMRSQCKCGTFFWSVKADQKTCGDPACSGGFRFFGKSPAKKEMDYIEVWREFAKHFSKLGYTPIDRYPVVARWRDDTDFVQASIYDFQPYVVSGEVKPPANPLVVPQFCVRFNDIDNVGITGAHYTGFVMIGQHTFQPPEKWDQKKYFSDIHSWLKTGLGLPNEEITFHEDAWAGGGNFGPSMEFFSRGLELGNQVYMQYEVTPTGNKELKLKVLDMGMGHERNAWFTKGTSTSYETAFPTVTKKLFSSTGIKVDNELVSKFLPYSSYLNIDEVEDINKTWEFVAKETGYDVKELREKITSMAALFCVAEHTRSLLFTINDGAIPSNTGGYYNLRVILRRALSFIDKYGWDIYLPDVAKWHAEYLKPIFPELSQNLENVQKILDVEKNRYENTKVKTASIIAKIIQDKIQEDKLLELYDSHGIPPEIIQEEAKKLGKEVIIPDDFYVKVSALHEKREQVHATEKEEKLDLENVEDTYARYYDDYTQVEFQGTVAKIIGKNVILNNTYFYPTSGGQIHDTGLLNGEKVVDVFKQGGVIIHVMNSEPSFREGDQVNGQIDMQRRKQLAQHHSSTHIVNAAAKRVLGSHINQAGAKKTTEKAHIDLTHYESLTDEQIKNIENEANKIVKEAIPLRLQFMSRDEAEKRYGMTIYQGGAVPGNKLRIVEIPGVDVECCGGTHLKNTSEAEIIKIQKSTKISDGIIRITFVAGEAAKRELSTTDNVASELTKLLGVNAEMIPARVEELFAKWKKAKKMNKDSQVNIKDFDLLSTDISKGDIIAQSCTILKTQPEHIVNTVKRFKTELEKMIKGFKKD